MNNGQLERDPVVFHRHCNQYSQPNIWAVVESGSFTYQEHSPPSIVSAKPASESLGCLLIAAVDASMFPIHALYPGLLSEAHCLHSVPASSPHTGAQGLCNERGLRNVLLHFVA